MWRRDSGGGPLSSGDGAVPRRQYPTEAKGYELQEEIGRGTSACVLKAYCPQEREEVAIKIIDLDLVKANIDEIWREIQVMSLSSHPNVVSYCASFVHGHDLWVVMPLLTGGSVESLMQCLYPEGFPEALTKYLLHEALKGLDYFHKQKQLHRDVKAANILLTSNGNAMLSDYGVMGWMIEGGVERKACQTFVGTPCWMAPEVMEQKHGYDHKADIWSFGITALELAQGHPPYHKLAPLKVMVKVLSSAPPRLNAAADSKYSRTFKEMVDLCLRKDARQRASTSELLQHKFFRNVRKPDDLVSMLTKMPPIGSRGGAQSKLFRQMKLVSQGGRSIIARDSGAFGWDFEGDDAQTDTGTAAAEFKADEASMSNARTKDDSVHGGMDGTNGLAASSAKPTEPGVVPLKKGRFTVSVVDLTDGSFQEGEDSDFSKTRQNASDPNLDTGEALKAERKSRFQVKELPIKDLDPIGYVSSTGVSRSTSMENNAVAGQGGYQTAGHGNEGDVATKKKSRFEITDIGSLIDADSSDTADLHPGTPTATTSVPNAQPNRMLNRFDKEGAIGKDSESSVAPRKIGRFGVMHSPIEVAPPGGSERAAAPRATGKSMAGATAGKSSRFEVTDANEPGTPSGISRRSRFEVTDAKTDIMSMLRQVTEMVDTLMQENDALRKEVAALKKEKFAMMP
mmetsp:Transcript_9008/g.27079  ORF Transcript_9008/g.27079 Transcript_9008/m.27079 type:complete len:682 (+) Transcript_9008:44-2089(+)